ncbi:MAG: hypothetical protein H6Q86_3905 [candidate division NC10 bacterium]|nr:hypothetical protein [candidate division NC10 bacterium]
MGKQRWVLACLCFVILGVLPWLALAQQAPAPPPPPDAKAEAMEEIRLTRVVIQAGRQAIVTEAMDLTPAEMETFWPLYREYRLEAAKVGDRVVALIERYAANYDTMTEEAANKLLSDFVKIERARADLKAKFLPRFKKVLPATKVMRFYQVENKMDIAVLNEMADQIPLVK